MIEVHKSVDADNRTATQVLTPEVLLVNTKSHIRDVDKGMNFIADQLIERGEKHDHTKIENINQFCDALKSNNVKNTFWYNMHIREERHHLKSNPPEDVTLIDVIEHLVDCTMAGLTRSGHIFDVDLPPELLVKAAANTVEMLKNNVTVVDDT